MRIWRRRVASGRVATPLTCVALLLLGLTAAACAQSSEPRAVDASDAALTDPIEVDPAYPPSIAELRFASHGASLNGLLYMAGGPGPHPTIALLHGFPGNEKNLDLAQAARRIGFNVLFFHYRGSWGSEGHFGFGNVVEDVAAALDFLRTEDARGRYRVDGERLILIGHSMGGFAALAAASLDPGVACVVAITPWDLAVFAEALEDGPEATSNRAGLTAALDTAGPLQGISGTSAINEILLRRADFDLKARATGLHGRPVLLVGARRDRALPPDVYFEPLVAAYQADPDVDLTHVMLDGDHSFSWTRIALIRTVTHWLAAECGAQAPIEGSRTSETGH